MFSSNRKGTFDLYRKAVDSVGAEELLYADDVDKLPTSWSADGKWLLYESAALGSRTGRNLWALPMVPERPGAALKPSPLLQTTSTEFVPILSGWPLGSLGLKRITRCRNLRNAISGTDGGRGQQAAGVQGGCDRRSLAE